MRSSRTHSIGSRDRGTYTLLLYLRSPKRIKVGSLGWIDFSEGYYAYTGSAMNNLRARVNRHMIKDKTPHWHIDYLIPYARIMRVLMFFSNKRAECKVVQKISQLPGAMFSVKGFGSSDCTAGCPSHLVYFPILSSLQ